MSDIAPVRAAVALSATTATSAAATAPALAAVAGGAIPTALAQLGVGAVISGVVAERGPRGQIVIRTDKGTLTVQTPMALRVGANVTVQIQSLGAQSQIMILSVDGQPLAGQHAGAAASSIKQNPSASSATPALASKTPIASDATVRTNFPASQPASTFPTLRTGAVLTGTLLSPSTSAQRPPMPSIVPAASSLSAPMVRGEDENVVVRILGVAPQPARPAGAVSLPDAPTRLIAELAAADDAVTFTATVMEPDQADSGKVTLLRTPFGLLRLPVPASEPPGAQIAIELLTPRDGATARIAPLPPELSAARQIIALGQEWPALREAVSALQADAPDVAQQTLAAAFPRVGPALAAGMLLFVAALRNGNLRNWLGDQAIETLERGGHGSLVKRLGDDIAMLPRLAETQPNGWQSLLLPVYDGEALRQIRLSLRRSRKDERGERKDGARFIIEAELSKLGPLQLDGLVRMPQFDLAVRTRDNLPPDIRANIVEIFNDALQATGLKGAVAFQASRDLRPGPFENWQASGHGLTV